jgi:nucleoside-diphosphate-sugar epimerase
MNVVITGGAGFLGQRVARALLSRGTLDTSGSSDKISRITLLDVTAPPASEDSRVQAIVGDVADRGLLELAIARDTGVVFHLAAVVSGMAEADFDLGMRVNIDATRVLLDVCRARGTCPRVVFTSSVAVYGGPLPDVVSDTTAVNPQSSYGTQKAVGELLVNDYSRKGFVDGRVLRLPTVSVRPGRPNAAASSFASGIIREPLNGETAICPVDPDTKLWLMSPGTATACLIHGATLPSEAFGVSRTVNLPGLTVTPRAMAGALTQVAGAEASSRIQWTRDPGIERIVATWPGAWNSSRALALGFPQDREFAAVIRNFVAEKSS